MIIRPETPADREAVFAVQEAAFGKAAAVAQLVDAIRASDRYVPELSPVAEEEDEVVGHTMLSYVDVDDARVLTLSPIGVRPDRQGGASAARSSGKRSGSPTSTASRSSCWRGIRRTTAVSASARPRSLASSWPRGSRGRLPGDSA